MYRYNYSFFNLGAIGQSVVNAMIQLLYPWEKRSGIPCTGVLVGFRSSPDGYGKSRPYEGSNPVSSGS